MDRMHSARIKDGDITEYTTKGITFICKNGHTSNYSWPTVEKRISRNRWIKCKLPNCKRANPKMVSEKMFCDILNEMFHIPFIKVRPFWLINTYTGHNLELDFYNEEYKIGFEYQERHHYYFTNYRNLYSVRKHDELKVRRCRMFDILLFQIPECESRQTIIDLLIDIITQLRFSQRGITYKNKRHSI